MNRILYSAIITLVFFCHVQAHVSLPKFYDLSGFNEPQKKVIIEELERYGKAIAHLHESNEEEWKKKVNEVMKKVFDGFRVYKLAAGNEPLNEYIRQFEDSTHLKVYVICYVEDAFMNNIFQRLAELRYETRQGNAIELRYKFKKLNSSNQEESLFQAQVEVLASEQVKQKIADQIKEKLNNKPPDDLYASLSEASISLFKEESFVTVRQKAEEILGRFEGLSLDVKDIQNTNCDCWRETYIRAAATFEDQLDDMDAEEVKYVSGINKVTVTAKLPLGDKFLQIEKVFEKSVDTEEYVQFLLNWKVDPFDARIIQTHGMKDCCSRIIGRTEENWRRNTPWVPALLADVMMGAPGTVYGWYTGDHWRTGEKLETWEQALGILDVVPGEALVKAGIVGLVSAYGVTLVKYANKAGKVIKNLEEFYSKIPALRLQGVKNGFKGTPVLKYAEEDILYYRRWGGQTDEIGSWLSTIKYSSDEAKKYLALPKVNSAENLTIFKIKKGTPYIQGKVASQANDLDDFGDYAVGGGDQIYILYEDLDKLIKQ